MILFHRFQLGSFNCMVLRDNSAMMPIQGIFPRVSEDELRQALDTCGIESDEVAGAYDLLYINTGAQQVLVDTGLPAVRGGAVLESMAAAGLDPVAIETIIITHGDGDHIGGIGNFPNARFVMPTKSWELWTDPKSRAGMVQEFIEAFRQFTTDEQMLTAQATSREIYGRDTLSALRDRVDLVEPETEFLSGFKLISAPGHRTDHVAVEISSQGETLLHVVDGFRHPVQILNPNWTSRVDSYPEQTTETIKMLLDRAVQSNATIFATHITFPGLGRLHQTDSGLAWQNIE